MRFNRKLNDLCVKWLLIVQIKFYNFRFQYGIVREHDLVKQKQTKNL